MGSPVPAIPPHMPNIAIPHLVSPPILLTNEASRANPTFHKIRQAGYTLDRSKQVKKLVKDATGTDFEIEINNKGENVTIVCNAGFYTKVAVTAMHSLTKESEKLYQGVTVQCQDIVGNFDATLAHQNTVIFFRLLSQDKVSLGSVRIHLHHTARKVQLQGGATMSGKTTAPVWFLDHVLQNKFSQLSQEKSQEITTLNQTIRSTLSSHPTNSQATNVCAGCNVRFDGRSSPEYCIECCQSYHKYKCFPSSLHPCHVRRRAQGSSSLPGQLSQPPLQSMARTCTTLPQPAQPLSTPNTTTQLPSNRAVSDADLSTQTTNPSSVPTDHHTVPILPQIQPRAIPPALAPAPAPAPNDHAVSHPVRHYNGPPQSLGSSASHVHTDHTAHSRSVVPVLNPNASPFVSHGNTQDATSHVTGHAQQKTRAKAKKNEPSTDKASTQIEFLKLEISTLQTRLQKQDDDLKDLKFRNDILMARNKSLEELKQQEIHERYFPSQGPHVQHTSSSCTGHGHTCCAQPVCHSRQFACPSTHHNPCSGQTTEIELINNKLEGLSRTVQKHQQVLDSLLHPEITWPSAGSVPSPEAPPSQTPPVTRLSPPPPPSQPAPTSPMVHSGQADHSTISLDGFMFGEDCDNGHLN